MVDTQSDFVKNRLAFVAECIEASKKEKPTVEDASMGRTAFIFRRGDDPVLVHYCTVPDLTPEDFKKFTQNYRQTITKFMSEDKGAKLEMNVLREVDGREIIHQRMDPGIFMVSARSMVVQQYVIEEGNGAHIFMTSSKDSADLEKEFAKAIGKDVIATLEVNYWHFKPTEDGKGTHVTHVNSSKPNGSIPNIVVNKMTAKQAEAIIGVSK